MPWHLLLPLNVPGKEGAQMSLASELLNSQPLPTLGPILFTIIWIIGFTVVALWRFQREEF